MIPEKIEVTGREDGRGREGVASNYTLEIERED